jgi:hypothetical protein
MQKRFAENWVKIDGFWFSEEPDGKRRRCMSQLIEASSNSRRQ